MRRLFPIIATLLVYLMTPSAGEITEHIVQHVTHADAVHQVDGHAGHDCEHGCSGPYHVCPCHHNVPFARVDVLTELPETTAIEAPLARWLDVRPPQGVSQSVYRPPIA